ncbi:FAD-dependent oxidoreductase [Amycolatopsis coloradensis]|uniref:FAD-dependent oxidoreductase n=1 Tax=Amycolatopsis coloradensis TaxID=76021 RepID=A0ACD5BPH4_9PSEU
MDKLSVDVCVVGGGPAGMALGLELARRGCDVAVVEQTSHFNRSFRGETVSPDAVSLLARLGILENITAAGALVNRKMKLAEHGRTLLEVDFDDFPHHHRHPLDVPQPTLLAIMEHEARLHASFTLLRNTSAIGLVESDGAIVGIRSRGPAGEQEIHARMTVGADGRYSNILEMSGLTYRREPLERDVVWLKLPVPADWTSDTYHIRIAGGRHGLFIPTYPDLMRVGFNIPKGGLRNLRRAGLTSLHTRLDELAPELADLVRDNIRNWSDTSVLDIFTSVVPRWSRPGLLLIGDAAHTLSPILGQGVSHALFDAMTLAPLLSEALPKGRDELTLAAREFQRIREPSLRRSRSLQLRQEKLFTFSDPVRVLLRSTFYRSLNRTPWLKKRLLNNVFFQLQKQ